LQILQETHERQLRRYFSGTQILSVDQHLRGDKMTIERPESFYVEVPVGDPDAMNAFQSFMDELHESTNRHIDELAKELRCSSACAQDVFYLRSRSRWTEELENELIQLHKQNNPPNMCEFGN
jgi:hypothetical protein